MLTPKERYDIAMAKLEAAASWRQDLLVYLTVAFIVFAPLTATLAWHYAGERAREERQGKMIALLGDLGADPIKARCAVEKITADKRQLCEKLVKE